MALKITIISIVFILVGLTFYITGLLLKSSVKKSPGTKIAGTIFYLMGALTLVSGILGLCFRNEITKTALQVYSLIYLVIISIIFFIITKLIKTES
ncbi:hypothetical protein [Treponema sp.]|uniref:hypothetical protein n=1 Tax=Treponema sp. TaxID=166 RepID=UPI0025E6B063|nr:hypothetical protein [Treponema sp.]MCR5218030.1 hypothetical protein [Treponema sp.]